MLQKLTFLMVMISINLNSYAINNPVEVSKRPQARPVNLDTSYKPKSGELYKGRMRVTLSFFDDGIFYQRNQREYFIPIMSYLTNEYPNIDFSKLNLEKININSRSLSDYSHIRLVNDRNRTLLKKEVPRVMYPNEVLGEYSNTTLEGRKIKRFLYVAIAGAQNINNITLNFVLGKPNFSMDYSKMPELGKSVAPMTGVDKYGFSEDAFEKIMAIVTKMNHIPTPEEMLAEKEMLKQKYEAAEERLRLQKEQGIQEERLRKDREFNNFLTQLAEDLDTNYSATGYLSEIARTNELKMTIGELKFGGGYATIELTSGRAKLLGMDVVFANGNTGFIEKVQSLNSYANNKAQIRLYRRHRFSNVTLKFADVTDDADAVVTWRRK